MGQQYHALQRKECQLCGILLGPVVQLGFRADTRCQCGKDGVPGQDM